MGRADYRDGLSVIYTHTMLNTLCTGYNFNVSLGRESIGIVMFIIHNSEQ